MSLVLNTLLLVTTFSFRCGSENRLSRTIIRSSLGHAKTSPLKKFQVILPFRFEVSLQRNQMNIQGCRLYLIPIGCRMENCKIILGRSALFKQAEFHSVKQGLMNIHAVIKRQLKNVKEMIVQKLFVNSS